MTTPKAAALYLAQHEYALEGRPVAIHNPRGLPVGDLPVIYGLVNGGSPGWLSALAIAEDGTSLAGHICSAEGYVPADLGVLDGTSPDKHAVYRAHYPDGYRMEFVARADIDGHAGLQAVIARRGVNH